MSNIDGKKLGFRPTVSDGGKTEREERPTSAEKELELAARELFYAMRGKDGKSISKNFRNASRGATTPLRMVVRRFKEAKAARAPKAYRQSKDVVRALDEFVDALHNRRNDTGEFRPPRSA